MLGGNRLYYAALGIALALASQALGQNFPDSQKGINNQEEAQQPAGNQSSNQPAEEAPRITSPITPAETEPSSETHNQNDKTPEEAQPNQPLTKWESWITRQDTLAQWIMAVFGVIATLVSIWAVVLLWCTLRATRDAIEETKAGTRAAEAAVEVAREASQRQLRAYVAIFSGRIQLQDIEQKNKQGIVVQITMKNSGQTPGYQYRTWLSATVDSLDAAPFRFPDDISRCSTSVIGPGIDANMHKSIAITKDDLDAVSKGEKKIFVWGRVEYIDHIRRNRHFVFRCTNGNWYPNLRSWDISPHRLGYEAN